MRLDHIGVVVADLARAREFFDHVLGLELVEAASLPEHGLNVAFYACGEVRIELIEVTEPGLRSERLGDAVARLEHIAIEVGDLEAELVRLRTHGIETTTPAPVTALGARNSWTRPATSGGVGFQFLERLG